MTFKDDLEAINYVKAYQSVPKWVEEARKYSKELCALVEGEDFHTELISVIEQIESPKKAVARKKYARDIKDYFQRLFLPIQNVFSSTGGVKNYQNGDVKLSKPFQEKLLSIVSNVRDGKSIERYIETQWMNLYHTDPSGVLWMRYTVDKKSLTSCYPTYQSIGVIRQYEAKGQLVEYIIFEPENVKDTKVWTIVDDSMQRTIIQTGESFSVDTDPLKTFKHPFGVCPIIINSDIVDKKGFRLSPIHNILPLSKEYARDQSIKTIYKFLQGFPKHWRRAMICPSCHGNGKNGNDICGTCGGKGETGKGDVTDQAIVPFPNEGDPVLSGKDIMGYESPDLESLKQMTIEIEFLEGKAYETLWGTPPMQQIAKTATEIHYDTQPQINRLNKYADVAEWIEWTLTEWIANAIDTAKAKDKAISLIVYGRRYILEGIDTIQKKYEDAKAAGENTVVLDGIFDELLTIKFKNDPEWMKVELLKARTEPYLHFSAKEIMDMFGAEEAARKVFFQRWWSNLKDADYKKEATALQEQYVKDFDVHLLTMKIAKPAPVNPAIPPTT